MDTNAVICSNTPYHPIGVYNILRSFMMLYTIGIYWDHRLKQLCSYTTMIWRFPKIGLALNHPFWDSRIFHYKPSILGEPHFRKSPDIIIYLPKNRNYRSPLHPAAPPCVGGPSQLDLAIAKWSAVGIEIFYCLGWPHKITHIFFVMPQTSVDCKFSIVEKLSVNSFPNNSKRVVDGFCWLVHMESNDSVTIDLFGPSSARHNIQQRSSHSSVRICSPYPHWTCLMLKSPHVCCWTTYQFSICCWMLFLFLGHHVKSC